MLAEDLRRPRRGLQPVPTRLGAHGGSSRPAGRPVVVSPLLFEAARGGDRPSPSGPPGSSTRPSARPSSSSATTGTSTRSPPTTRAPMSRRSRPPAGGGSSSTAPPAPSPSRPASTSTSVPRPRRSPPTGLPAASPPTLGCGALVNLGGDVAVAGSAPGRRVGGRDRPAVHRRPPTRSTRWSSSTPGAWPPRAPPPGPGCAAGAPCTTSSTRGPARRPRPSGPWCRPRRRPASRPMPGARRRWSGATTPSAT